MTSELFTLADIESAMPVVRAAVPPTPQYAYPQLAVRTGAEVFVKHENHTPVGAFKVRGGLVYMDRLRRAQPQVAGIVSATRGNHGQSPASPRPSWCRTAIQSRRTPPCAPSAPTSSSTAATSTRPRSTPL
jgi:threonine dehydratase